jgi:hypothetical protein
MWFSVRDVLSMAIETDLERASHFAVGSIVSFQASDPDSFRAGRMALATVSTIDRSVIGIGQLGERGVFVHSKTRR